MSTPPSRPVIPVDGGAHPAPQPQPLCPKHRSLGPMNIMRVKTGLAVHNPTDTPVFVAETHALGADGITSVGLVYNEPVFVPAREMVLLPKTSYIAEQLERNLRVIYVDGWGEESVRDHAVNLEQTSSRPERSRWATVAADERCSTPPPPLLEPLVLTHRPEDPVVECVRGCHTAVSIGVHNPTPYRVRLTGAWVDHPGGGTTGAARRDDQLHYVNSGATIPLPYRIRLDRAGVHRLRVEYVDGWARRHVARTQVRARLLEQNLTQPVDPG